MEQHIYNKVHFLKNLKRSHRKLNISFINPFSYMVIKDKTNLLSSIEHFYIDGLLLVKLHNMFFRSKKVDRVSFDFSSIADVFFQYVQTQQLRVTIIGGCEDELYDTLNNLISLYPKINFIACRNGYFDSTQELRDYFLSCGEQHTDVYLIGMGTPKQEEALKILRDLNIDYNIAVTCGGFLSQTAIKADYYHPLVKKFGLRWLQRAIMYKHVRHRLLKDYPRFIFFYLKKNISNKILKLKRK